MTHRRKLAHWTPWLLLAGVACQGVGREDWFLTARPRLPPRDGRAIAVTTESKSSALELAVLGDMKEELQGFGHAIAGESSIRVDYEIVYSGPMQESPVCVPGRDYERYAALRARRGPARIPPYCLILRLIIGSSEVPNTRQKRVDLVLWKHDEKTPVLVPKGAVRPTLQRQLRRGLRRGLARVFR